MPPHVLEALGFGWVVTVQTVAYLVGAALVCGFAVYSLLAAILPPARRQGDLT
jgi:hypothetical protein